MARQERSKKSTVSNMIATMKSVSQVLMPTHDLSETEMKHFDRIVTSRESSTWSPHDLSIATQLARALRRFDELQQQLDSDGLTVSNDRGTIVAHPLLSASMSMSSTIQALSRTLGLGASQRGLSGSKQATRNQADQSARDVLAKVAEDSLLA